MKPITLKHKIAGGQENQVRNIVSCFKRKLPEFKVLSGEEAERNAKTEVFIVGSGPTLRQTIEEIKEASQGKFIIAVNDGHDFLIEHGIVPHMLVAVDPRPRISNGFKKLNKETTYLIASQCHPLVFDRLKGFKVLVWHSGCAALQETVRQMKLPQKVMIHGGTTASLRAMALAWCMGFRMFHLYGVDSSFSKTERNIDGRKATDHGFVEVGGATFMTDKQMMSQANELVQVLSILPGSRLQSHGDSLTTAVLNEAAKYRKDCYDSTENIYRVRPETATSVYGGGAFITEALKSSCSGDTAEDSDFAVYADRPHGVHLQPLSRPVAL